MTSVARDVIEAANKQSRRLKELIAAPEILVMPGAYDVLTARLFESMGFPAVQGSSGAIQATFGLLDSEYLGRERTVALYKTWVEHVSIPVNADGERGYGGPEEIPETVRQMVAAGLAGMNLEDSEAHPPGTPFALARLDRHLEKIAAFMETRHALGSEFCLNARVDAFLAITDPAEALREAIARGNAYAEAGAECVFFIRAGGAENIRTLVREVNAPVSILAGPTAPAIPELEQLGVARVSYGLAFGHAALGGVRRLAEVMLAKGDPSEIMRQGMPMPDVVKLLGTGS